MLNCFYFSLLKSIRSRSALEIGTYLAGTTKIISEALGKDGFILTIEANKNRNEFIKKEISTWEKEFQKNTMPVTSQLQMTSLTLLNLMKNYGLI